MLVAGSTRASFLVFAILLFGTLSASSFELPVFPILGIDLGTTHSCFGVYHGWQIEIIANDQGKRITPSWVAFTDDQVLIGEAAKNQADVNAERTIFDVQRLIGRKFEDEEVQRVKKLVPYKIVSKDGKAYIEVKIKGGETRLFSPEEISAMILTKMKQKAEAYVGYKIKYCVTVITVPAYFNDAQRQAMKDAAVIAGFNIVKIVNEPTAAASAYRLDKKGGKKNILVFDLGGGTFDVSILTIDNGVFEVLATNGDTRLGGGDFDQRVVEYFIKLIKNKHGKDISKDNRALGKLRREAEHAKRALSSQHQVHLEIESIFDGNNFSEPFARAHFEELNNDLFRKTLGPVKKAMEDAGLEKRQIDEIVLVGGSTRIPKVQQLLKDYFDGKEPNKGVNPEEAVAYGAVIQGGIFRGIDILSPEEIERMVREAEEFYEENNKMKEKIDARNRLETCIFNIKNQINDEDKINEKEKIATAVKEALKWLDDNRSAEKEDFDEKLKEVEAVCNPIITAVYNQRSVVQVPQVQAQRMKLKMIRVSHDEL